MLRIIQLLHISFLVIAAALPSTPRPDIHARDGVSPDALNAAKQAYRGIYWDVAAQQCTGDQFNILVEATRMALKLAEYDYKLIYSYGWHRFFVSNSRWETVREL